LTEFQPCPERKLQENNANKSAIESIIPLT